MHGLPWPGAETFLLFTLVLTRVSGLTITAPIFGGKDAPARVRALLALAIALLMLPTQRHVPVTDPGTTLNYLVLLAAELMVGLCLGLGMVILFAGLQIAGELIGRLGGLMLANVFDPTMDTEVPLFSRLLFLTAMAVFVCIGGHRMLMAALLDTFAALPPGGGAVPLSMADALVTLVSQSFLLGIRAALPLVTALLLSTLVLGLISRTLPQLNILMVGFGMNAMLTFAILGVTLGGAVWALQDQIEPALDIVLDAIHP